MIFLFPFYCDFFRSVREISKFSIKSISVAFEWTTSVEILQNPPNKIQNCGEFFIEQRRIPRRKKIERLYGIRELNPLFLNVWSFQFVVLYKNYLTRAWKSIWYPCQRLPPLTARCTQLILEESQRRGSQHFALVSNL